MMNQSKSDIWETKYKIRKDIFGMMKKIQF